MEKSRFHQPQQQKQRKSDPAASILLAINRITSFVSDMRPLNSISNACLRVTKIAMATRNYDAVFVSAAISVSTFYAAFLVSAAVVSAAVVSAAVVSAAVSSTAGFSARFAVAALSSLPSIAFTAF